MKKTMLILAAAMMTLMPISASAAFRGGVVVVRPFYGARFYNPYWGGYWGPGFGNGYYPYANTGQVKLDTKVKDAQVFINDAYAGTTHDNKTMHLRPGNYKIEVRDSGRTLLAENVYVVAGKTVHLSPAL